LQYHIDHTHPLFDDKHGHGTRALLCVSVVLRLCLCLTGVVARGCVQEVRCDEGSVRARLHMRDSITCSRTQVFLECNEPLACACTSERHNAPGPAPSQPKIQRFCSHQSQRSSRRRFLHRVARLLLHSTTQRWRRCGQVVCTPLIRNASHLQCTVGAAVVPTAHNSSSHT
jgi:hypothetical protein